MTIVPFLAVAWLAAADPAPPAKPTMPPGTPAEQVKALIGQYDAAYGEFRKHYQAAASDEERENAVKLFSDNEAYATLLMTVTAGRRST